MGRGDFHSNEITQICARVIRCRQSVVDRKAADTCETKSGRKELTKQSMRTDQS